jgi:hypothetical protein
MILGVNVTPCEGEVSVKSYQCTEFVSRFFGINAKGYLEVTNKRLLFQAIGMNRSGWSAIHKEVAIGEVSDIKIYKGSTFRIPLFLIGLILSSLLGAIFSKGIDAVLQLQTVGNLIGIGIFGYGGYMFYLWSKKEAFSLIVNTKGGTGNVVYLASISPFSSGNSAASKALIYTKPGADSEILLREIGAVIHDVQTLGDFAVEKWKTQS